MVKVRKMTNNLFEQAKTAVESLDTLMNERVLSRLNSSDREERGFEPSKTYSSQELRDASWEGSEALKITGRDSKYLLLEVRIEEGDRQYNKFFLRGFERGFSLPHVGLAEEFLRELQKGMSFSELPSEWPSTLQYETRIYERQVNSETDGVRISVFVCGGGKYDLQNRYITLKGESDAFGPVSVQHQRTLHELLSQLVERPAYQGFRRFSGLIKDERIKP